MIFQLVLLFGMAVGIVLGNDLVSAPHRSLPAPMTSFSGGTFEASGVAHVPGTDGVLFVDDGRPQKIFWMQLGEDRKQAGAIKTIGIATSIVDLEGITTDGEYFYVVGSQSKSKGADQAGLVEGQALVVPLKLRDPKGALTFDNLEVEGRKAIRLPLGGAGIRSIEYDEARKAFSLITGAGPNSEKMDFKTWEWSGHDATPTLRELETFDRRRKPEGITRFPNGAKEFTFIVFDTSGYAATD